MELSSPIKAHQQTAPAAAPLLRRPRPPKRADTRVATTDTRPSRLRDFDSRGGDSCYTNGTSRARDRGSQRVSPRPHPTPFTPHGYAQTPSSSLPFTRTSLDRTTTNSSSGTPASEPVVHALYPRGPPGLPPGRTLRAAGATPYWLDLFEPAQRQHGGIVFGEEEEEDDDRKGRANFTLNDFQLSAQASHHVEVSSLKGALISRQNYLKLTSWFSVHVPTQSTVNTVSLTVDLEAPECRKPQQQVLIELRYMVQELLASTGHEATPSQSSFSLDSLGWPTPTPNDAIFQASTSRYFCGQGRSDSPFDARHQPLIAPSEAAILESMMEGGSRLSLKAHFLSELPDLTVLASTLTHLNLSFNSLRVFPAELLQLVELRSLKMRNNPLRELPNDIRKLVKLEIFCVSFNILSDLPPGLFEVTSLVELDVSHNNLQGLSRDVGKLRRLRRLNVEANQLCGLPSSALSLPLSHVLLADNYTHPLLWRDSTRNQPQTLVDLCCSSVSRMADGNMSLWLPSQALQLLESRDNGTCDCCAGRLFGTGLRAIRASTGEQFGTKHLPFIFTVCSPTCRIDLKQLDVVARWTAPSEQPPTHHDAHSEEVGN